MKTNCNTKHIIILIFAIFLLGCTEEINNLNVEEASDTEIASDSPQEEASLIVSQNEVSSNQIPNVISHLRNKIGSKYFRSERSEAANENDPIIDYEHITAVLDTLRNTNYSINFVMPNGPKNTFYNLVIGVDSLGAVTDPIVVKYALDEQQEQMFIDSGHDFSFFKGSIALENYSKYFSSNIFLASDTHCNQEFDENGDPLPCDILDVNNTGSSGGSGGSSGSFSGNHGGGVACTVTSVWSGCGGSNSDTAHGSSGCGGNGNGSGWVVTVTCPNGSHTLFDQSRYTNSQDTSECPSCNIGPSGPSGVNIGEIARIYNLIDVMKQNNVTFTAAQESFLKQQSNFALTEQIYSFWYNSDRDAVSIVFIKNAIDALIDGGEVDFENKIILDSTFINNEKVKCIYDKLKGLSSTIFNEIIDGHFESAKNAHIRFKIKSTPGGEEAFTRSFANGNSLRLYEVQLNPNAVENSSTIEIALILIHESIHAELLDRCIQLGIINGFDNHGNPIFSDASTFSIGEALFAFLVLRYQNFNGVNSQWNHDLFNVFNYRDKMAQNLVNIHPWLNDINNDFFINVNTDFNRVGNPYSLEELMEYVSWIGLEGTQEYINTVQNNLSELQRKEYVEQSVRTMYTKNCE